MLLFSRKQREKPLDLTNSEQISLNVIIEALCCYRDQLIMSEEYGTPANRSRLLAIDVALEDTWQKLEA